VTVAVQSEATSRPRISVIVPAHNAERWIGTCIDALLGQNIERGSFEILVVDDASADGTGAQIAARGLSALHVSDGPRGPYAARNLACAAARGSIFAFTDADCRPTVDWLSEAVAAIETGQADLVAGRVLFDLGPTPKPCQLVDALWHLDAERQVRENRGAMTSNLVVHRRVVDGVGPFREVRSGEDGRWTRSAYDAGFVLRYVPNAVVCKRARNGRALLKKGWRTGRGLPTVWAARGVAPWKHPLSAVRNALPPPLSRIAHQARRRELAQAMERPLAIWFWTWLLEMTRSAGALSDIFQRAVSRVVAGPPDASAAD